MISGLRVDHVLSGSNARDCADCVPGEKRRIFRGNKGALRIPFLSFPYLRRPSCAAKLLCYHTVSGFESHALRHTPETGKIPYYLTSVLTRPERIPAGPRNVRGKRRSSPGLAWPWPPQGLGRLGAQWALMAGDYRGDGSQPKVWRSDPAVTC